MIINEYLIKNNISKYQFAKSCNLPYTTLNDICNGKTNLLKCSGETLLKIANAIGTSIDELLKQKVSTIYSLDYISNLIKPIANKYKIKEVYVFGSYARGEANNNSDIDLLVDLEDSNVKGMFQLGGLYNDLKEALNKEIDLVTMDSLKQNSNLSSNIEFFNNVMNDKKMIYGGKR